MTMLPPIVVRHPRPHDLVGDPVVACGIGTGFEGVFAARVRDGAGVELEQVPIHAGGTAIWGNFHAELPLDSVPTTPQGTLEVFGVGGNGGEVGKVVVPIVFGSALVAPDVFHGFEQHEVESGETLQTIAQLRYEDSTKWQRIFDANRDRIAHPDWIFPGQVLRIPR